MPTTKEYLFDNRLQLLADAAKAFNHPARLRILFLLRSHNGLNANQLVARAPKDYHAIGYHLTILRKIKVIKLGKHDLSGNTVYKICPDRFDQLLSAIDSIVSNFEFRKAA